MPDDDLYSLRPYLLTGGRVAGEHDLPLEAQVVAVGPAVGLRHERGAILDLAAEPLSVAELAALLRLQVGVVRVLVSELHAAGHLAVHAAPEYARDVRTLQRVVHGLRSLA